jgi:hypothetical protein
MRGVGFTAGMERALLFVPYPATTPPNAPAGIHSSNWLTRRFDSKPWRFPHRVHQSL